MSEGFYFKDDLDLDIYLKDIPSDRTLNVTTEDRTYLIEKREDGLYVFDGIDFPTYTKVNINSFGDNGSVDFIPDYLKAGLKMNIVNGHKKSIDTKNVTDITIL